MKRDKIDELLNPDNETETAFHIDAAVEHIQSKTHRKFEGDDGKLDLPADLVKAVRMLVDSANDPSNVSSESVAGELSVSYFNADATASVAGYWRPYRKLSW